MRPKMKGKNKGMAARVMEENTHVFVPCGENMLNLTMADFAKESIQNKSLCGVVQKLFFFIGFIAAEMLRNASRKNKRKKYRYTSLFSAGVRQGEESLIHHVT